MDKRGIFLVLEGVEGSGKSTQVRLLADWLQARGIDCVVAREPGGTAVGEEIRQILLERNEVPARSELLLMLAARALFVEQVVRPALERGALVIADRFELSTLAYQGYGRGLPLEEVRRINAFATGGLQPDLTLVLDVPVAVGEERRAAAGRSADRIERAGEDFHARVARAYRLLAQSESKTERIDGTGTPAEVQGAILRQLRRRFPGTFPPEQG